MKFEIRRVRSGAVLRVETDYPDAAAEEVVYQEVEDDEIEAFAGFLRHLVDQRHNPEPSAPTKHHVHPVILSRMPAENGVWICC